MQVVGELDSDGKQDVFIVGLAGASASGKSTAAKRVASRLKGHALSMENYSIVMNDLPLGKRAKQNEECRLFALYEASSDKEIAADRTDLLYQVEC
jgi:cytidylate kinase